MGQEEKRIELDKFMTEQRKLAKLVAVKDSMNFELVNNVGALHCESFEKKLIATGLVMNLEFEILDEAYEIGKSKFPYVPGFRAYRELDVLIKTFEKLKEPCDVFFILAAGIMHPRFCGLASHLGIAINKPIIGISKKLLVGEERENKVILKGKVVAEKVQTKEGAKPIYVSPGHLISLKSAVMLTKKFIVPPHKLPEPIVRARRLADKIRENL